VLCLLFKLASNSRPIDEIGSIEEMIEENELTKPIFQSDKVKFLKMANYFCLNSKSFETATVLMNEL